MRSLRGTILALGAALGALGVAGIVEMGCGSSSSPTSPSDSGTDSTSDGETETGPETGTETGAGDSAPEAMTDAGPMPDVQGGDADAMPVGLVVALNEATAYCTKWLSCCPTDAGPYSLQECINYTTTFGWEGTLPLNAAVYSRGNITVNQSKAAGCVTALNGFPCGTQTPAQWGAITSACEGVIQGTIASGTGGCIDSFECAPGNFCDPTVDGGLCSPLVGQGQPCNTKINDPNVANGGTPPLADQMCSYLSSGTPALFCDLIDNGPDAATCQPLLANGASCSNATNGYYDDQACTPPALCGDNLQCGGTASYPYANFCQFYAPQPKDAGAD
jgi:hypothetical protein